MKFTRFKYYDYFILSFMIFFWICGICGMEHREQHKANVGTSFSAVATAAAINLNIPTRFTTTGSPTQKNSRDYSQV